MPWFVLDQEPSRLKNLSALMQKIKCIEDKRMMYNINMMVIV